MKQKMKTLGIVLTLTLVLLLPGRATAQGVPVYDIPILSALLNPC